MVRTIVTSLIWAMSFTDPITRSMCMPLTLDYFTRRLFLVVQYAGSWHFMAILLFHFILLVSQGTTFCISSRSCFIINFEHSCFYQLTNKVCIGSGNQSCGLRNSSLANFEVLIGLFVCIFHLFCFFCNFYLDGCLE